MSSTIDKILLNLVLSTREASNHVDLLKTCLPVYIEELKCDIISVLKEDNNNVWQSEYIEHNVNQEHKELFTNSFINSNLIHNGQQLINDWFIYTFELKNYGKILFLKENTPIDKDIINRIDPVLQNLSQLLQCHENKIKKQDAEKSLKKNLDIQTISLELNNASVFTNNIMTGEASFTPHLYKYLGYKPDEMPSNMEETLSLLHKDDVNNVLQAIEDHKSGKNPNYYSEFRLRARNGNWVWVEGRGKFISTNNGEPQVLVGISQEITKRKEVEFEMIKAKEKAIENDRLKSAFLANMSHEIRTPMNGILGFMQLLEDATIDESTRQSYMNIIEDSGNRMLNTLNNLINISKIEADQMEVYSTVFDAIETAKNAFKFFTPEAQEKGLDLCNCINKEEKITVFSDKEKFHAIITNLTKNAIKYTVSGSVELGYFNNGNPTFFVKDTGIGMNPEEQKTIFDQFFQVRDTKITRREGAGLGLSICRAYADMLGWKIWVESKKNGGSTFYLSITIN